MLGVEFKLWSCWLKPLTFWRIQHSPSTSLLLRYPRIRSWNIGQECDLGSDGSSSSEQLVYKASITVDRAIPSVIEFQKSWLAWFPAKIPGSYFGWLGFPVVRRHGLWVRRRSWFRSWYFEESIISEPIWTTKYQCFNTGCFEKKKSKLEPAVMMQHCCFDELNEYVVVKIRIEINTCT